MPHQWRGLVRNDTSIGHTGGADGLEVIYVLNHCVQAAKTDGLLKKICKIWSKYILKTIVQCDTLSNGEIKPERVHRRENLKEVHRFMKKILAIVLCLVMVLSLLPTVSFAAGQTYTKVTTEQEDWSGTYLIAYVDGSDAYVYTGVDVNPNNNVKVANTTEITATDGMCAVQIEKYQDGYSIKLLSGNNSEKYLSRKGIKDNGTKFNDSAVELSISYTGGHTVIKHGDAPFQFNNDDGQLRFRFFGKNNGGQQEIDLYKLTDSCDHVWDDGVVTTPASCSADGVKTFTCTKNSSHTKTEAIPALGHNFGADGKCGNTGCTQEGVIASLVANITDGMKVVIYNKSTSAVVGGKDEQYKSGTHTNTKVDYVPAYKWDYSAGEGDWIVTQPDAVLTVKVNDDGTYSFLNSDGKYLYAAQYDTKYVSAEDVAESNEYTTFTLDAATGGWNIKSVDYKYFENDQHLNFNKGVVKLWTKSGEGAEFLMNFYQVCAHANTEVKNDDAATCIGDGYTGDTYCKDCGVKLSSGDTIPANGIHTGGTATCTEKAECSVCHEKYGDLADHKGELTWAEQGEGHIQKYSVCGCTVGEVEDHDHDGENGVCSKCGHGCEHTGGTATCDKQAVCEKCNNPYGKVDKTNHSGETELKNDKEATCGAAGYTGDTYCKACGEKLEDGDEIPATGKHVDEGKDHKCDVCEAPVGEHKAAENSHKCGYCGETMSECADSNADGKCDVCGAAMETKPDDKDDGKEDNKPDDKDDGKEDNKPVTDPDSITAQLVTSLKDGMHIIIYNPGDGVINTGVEYEYVNSKTGNSKWELKTAAATVNGKTLTAAKADACILTVKLVNGHYSFVNADGKYLYMDTNDVKFVDEAGDYTLFDLEKAEGGFFIKSVNAVYTYKDKDTNETISKPQYLELFSGCLTVYSMNASKPELYTFQFYTTDEVNSESGDPIAMVLGLMAVSGLGITVLKKKEH